MKYILILLAMLSAGNADAKERLLQTSSACSENYITDSYISVNVNDIAPSYLAAQQKFNEHVKMIKAIANEAEMKKLELQNSNISVSPNGNKQYNVSGSLSYKTMDTENKIFAFLDRLEKNNINASFSSNKRTGSTPCIIAQ